MEPVIKALKERYGDQVVFVTVNTDNSQESLEMLRIFSVRYLPTYFFISSDGQVVGEETGAKPEDHLVERIESLLLNQ